jgi:SAM-dependent methyltransferase
MLPSLVHRLPKPLFMALSTAGTYVASRVFAGSRYTDPIDGRSYKRFLPHGPPARRRENVLCPGTLSLERHRLMWLFLKSETKFFTTPLRVLHIAPEQCFFSRFRRLPNLEYVTGDLSSPIADIRLDLHRLPFADADFDVVICNHVLEHVDDDRACLRELRRVLRAGGFALLNVPFDRESATTLEDPTVTDPRERERLFWQSDHVRLYGMDYAERVRAAGFDVQAIEYARRLRPADCERYRLMLDDTIFYAEPV